MALSPSKVPGKKAGPNGSFPIGDAKHARLAIGGATRSYNAGNIGKSTEERIKAQARAKLGISPGGYVPNPQMDKPHMHALSIAAATHLHRAGHISQQQAGQIQSRARESMQRAKGIAPPAGAPNAGYAPPAQPQPQSFGSLAPMGQNQQ